MIRLFTVFCKLNFNKLSAKELFLNAMEEFTTEKLPFLKMECPNCGAKNPIWSYHDSYSRFLISFKNKIVITDVIDITRIICSSCKHAHAILPEIIVPHNSYSFLFIINVLKDYFLMKMTIKLICEKYQITASMLYRWKNLFLLHKQLWLGIIENIYRSIESFLSSIPIVKTSEDLREFFRENNLSFLQGASKTAHFNSG